LNEEDTRESMMRLVPTQEELPPGSHSLSFYASRPEAARNMASFLKGAQNRGQKARIITADDGMLGLYQEEVSKVVPEMSDSFLRISGPHVVSTPEGLRVVPEAMQFAAAHPEGATMCGDTIPSILDRRSLPNILVYEDWFDSLRPFHHRGLCPYDLAHIPVDQAPNALAHLARAHTHAVLSRDPNPGVRFLQLLILPHVENPPEENLGWLAQAVDYGLLNHTRDEESVELTPRGENFARALMALPEFARRATDSARQRKMALSDKDENRRASPFRFEPDPA
jgi:hypothetical protein